MEKKEWHNFYGDVPHNLHYPEGSLYDLLKKSIEIHPHAVAYDFLDKTATYTELGKQIDEIACKFQQAGFRPGDTLSIIMPTSPQGILAFYAVNKLGGVASFIHPLSTEEELKHYLTLSHSRFALTLDIFYKKVAHIKNEVPLEKLFVTKISTYMPTVKKLAYGIITLPKKKVKPDPDWAFWLEKADAKCEKPLDSVSADSDALSVILYSGGTTGVPKGVMLTNKNIVSEGMMVAAWGKLDESDTILAILPIFHGFGLSVCVNAALLAGAKTVLIPKFTVKEVAGLISRKKTVF